MTETSALNEYPLISCVVVHSASAATSAAGHATAAASTNDNAVEENRVFPIATAVPAPRPQQAQ